MRLPKQAVPILRHTNTERASRNQSGVIASVLDCYRDANCSDRLPETSSTSEECCDEGGRSYQSDGGGCTSCPFPIPRNRNQDQQGSEGSDFVVGGPPRPGFPAFLLDPARGLSS